LVKRGNFTGGLGAPMMKSSTRSSSTLPFSSLPPITSFEERPSRASRIRNSVQIRMSTTAKLNSNGLQLRSEIDNAASNSGQPEEGIVNVSSVEKASNLQCLAM